MCKFESTISEGLTCSSFYKNITLIINLIFNFTKNRDMKLNFYILIILSGIFPSLLSAQYNLSEASNFIYPAGFEMSGCWGYTDSSGREYAIIGTSHGTSILNVTIPEAPEELFFIEGGISTWREAKVWNNHAYISTEAWGEGMLIIDLINLPISIDTVTYKGNAAHPYNTAHTIFIDDNGICYLFGYNILFGTVEGAFIVDLNPDPENPVYLGEFTSFYVHDGYVRNDTMWVAEIYEGRFEVLDVSDKSDIILLGTQNTGGSATHNCWPSDDGKYLFTTDEINYGFIESFDVTDITDIKKIDAVKHGPPDSTVAHNTCYYNGYLVTAHYSEGVTIHDVNKPDNMVEVAHFDTTPIESLDAYEGVWGVYPYFNSQNIIATDRQEGVFILQPNYQRACYLEGAVTNITTMSNIYDAKIKILTTDIIDSSNILGEYKTGYHQNGIYDIEISASGCATQIYNDIALTTGDVTILNAALECALSIEDNPFENGEIIINYDPSGNIQILYDLIKSSSAKLELLNVSGQRIESLEISGSGASTIITNSIAPGSYFISFDGGKIKSNKKIIIY